MAIFQIDLCYMVPFSILGFIGAKDDVGGGNNCIVCNVQSSSQIVTINKPNIHLFTGQMPSLSPNHIITYMAAMYTVILYILCCPFINQ